MLFDWRFLVRTNCVRFQLPCGCRSPNTVHVFSLHPATRQTMYVLRNTVARSHYHCCSVNAALLSVRAVEPHVTVSSIKILSIGYQIFLWKYDRYVGLHLKCPMVDWKNKRSSFAHRRTVWSLRGIKLDIIINVTLIVVRLCIYQSWISSTDCGNNAQVLSIGSLVITWGQTGGRMDRRTDGQTDMTRLIPTFAKRLKSGISNPFLWV